MNRRRKKISRVASALLSVGCLALTQLGHAAIITGRVMDGATGQPIGGVQLLADGIDTGVVTDATGNFRLVLPEGEKVLMLKKAGFLEQSLGRIEIAAEGERALPVAKLYSATADDLVTLDAMVVEGQLVENSVVTARQNADISVDLISAADFGKFTGTDVSDVIVRVPGLSTTSQGSFAVVRGLAERYNPVMLDGIVLPSSDPERQSPELDIFPSRLVDAIVISKTYEAKLPSFASGGAIDLRTKPLPEEQKGQIYLGLRATDGSLGKNTFRSYAHSGGSTGDLLGNGASDRPAAPATDAALRLQVADTTNAITGNSKNEPFGGRVGFSFEDRIDLNTDTGRAFGYSVSYAYDLSYDSEEGRNADVIGFANEDYIKSEELVRQGGLVTLGYAFSEAHVLSFSSFISRVAQDEIRSGFNELDGSVIVDTTTFNDFYDIIDNRPQDLPTFAAGLGGLNLFGSEALSYKQRQLFNNKVGGSHDFKGPHEVTLHWSAANIRAEQTEPDTSVIPYSFNPVAGTYQVSAGAGARTFGLSWRDTEETTNALRADFEAKPDFGGSWRPRLSAGVYMDRTERDYKETVYGLLGGSFLPATSLSGIGAILAGASPSVPFIGGRSTGSGEREDDSIYVSGVFPLIEQNDAGRALDLVAGVRFNQLSIESGGVGRVGNFTSADFYQSVFFQNPIPSASISENQIFPGLGLIYSPKKGVNFRFGFSQTSARPSFREIGNYFTRDEISDDLLHGNTNLTTSDVQNLDARFEYFVPDSTDLFALSVFRKQIDNPIERIALPFAGTGNVVTWINNNNTASLNGLEFEVAKNLGFLADFVSDFTAGGNFTHIHATVERSIYEFGSERRLFDQPKEILNLYLTYAPRRLGLTTTLSLFSISEVLQTAQAGQVDRYRDGYSRVDLTVTKDLGEDWRVRLTGSNLTDSTRRFIGDPEKDPDQQVFRTYKDGRSYTVTLTREF